MPRVIAGRAGGLHLESPKGVHLRPMMDRVRGALFDMLWNLGAIRGRVLDCYAGTGAVGIEALSRGADEADFIEMSRQGCATISRNLAHTGFSSQGRVHCRRAEEVLRAPAAAGLVGPYDLISLTPPYDEVDFGWLVETVAASSLVAPDTVVVVEHPAEVALPDEVGPLLRLRDRAYGRTRLSVYDYPVEAGDEEQPDPSAPSDNR